MKFRSTLVGLVALSCAGCIVVQENPSGRARPLPPPQSVAPAAQPSRPAPPAAARPAPPPARPPEAPPKLPAGAATRSARVIVKVIGGVCALSVDGKARGIGAELKEPISLGDHEVVCLADRSRMVRKFTVTAPSDVPLEFHLGRVEPPPSAPPQPVDPRTVPVPLPPAGR